MEAMDIFLATTKELSYLVLHHPFYSILGGVLSVALLLRFYCRLTLGVCDCQQDMTGKTVLITGASSGVGKATALDLARKNARIVMCCRNLGKAQKVAKQIRAETGNDQIVLKALDLSSFESVRKCASEVLESEEAIHVLINNAGITGIPNKLTEDGCNICIQSNHLGHFLLTFLLLDLLKKSSPSRIINVASEAHKMAKLDPEDLMNKNTVAPLTVYSNSKLFNVLFTLELAARLSRSGITVNAVHPGFVKSDIFDGYPSKFNTFFKALSSLTAKSIEEGAQTSIHLAVSPDLEKTTGKYFMDCKERTPAKVAEDKALRKRLFEVSEEIVGVTYPKTL